jgi:hypothetical protein
MLSEHPDVKLETLHECVCVNIENSSDIFAQREIV